MSYEFRSSTTVMLRVCTLQDCSKGCFAFCTVLRQPLLLLPAVPQGSSGLLRTPQGSELVAVTPGEAGGAVSGFGFSPHVTLLFTRHYISSTYSHCNISTMASCLRPSLSNSACSTLHCTTLCPQYSTQL